MEWKFNKLTKNETIRNPSHLEFFHDEALQSVVDAFVREDIQNRLDAKARNKTHVRLEYSLCGPKSSSNLKRWFNGLHQHLSAPGIIEELGYTPQIGSSVTWLLAEDFETTGLNGDPQCFQDPPSGQLPRNDFYRFIRNVGRSGKSGAERGRWGLGKIVYPAASSIRSFYAYTVQEGSLRNLLIGRSVLSIHHLNGAQYDSEGYFGEYLDKDAEYFSTPSESQQVIQDFRRDFNISRENNMPGLSIAIPFPDADITFTGLIESIVKHWFMVLIEGRLQVKVRFGSEVVEINGDTLEQVIEAHFAERGQQQRLLRQVGFARVVQDFDQRGDTFFSLNRPKAGMAPKWSDLKSGFKSEEQLELAREAYRSGKPVGFLIPVHVSREDGSMDRTPDFEVFLQRTDDPVQASEVFLRDGMAILGLGSLRESGVLAVVRAENNELGTLLGDAENPAHTRWERGSKHFRNKYKYGPSILTFVKQSAERISTFLTTSEDGQDKEVLRSLFYLPDEGEGKGKKQTKSGGGNSTIDRPAIETQKRYITVDRRNDGFVVRPNTNSQQRPDSITIRAAYDIDRGNPFKAHHPADFDFTKERGGLEITLQGMKIEKSEPNRIVCSVTGEHFEFSAQGFDRNRDLIVDVRPQILSDSSTTEAEEPENQD